MRAEIKSSSLNSSTIILFAIYLLVVIRLWIMPMGSSFWLDETLTYWNVKEGVFETVERSAECPGQFQLYMAITAVSAKIFGLNEFGLRLPSLIASLFSSFFMFRLGRRFANTETGIFAAILFAALPEIALEASNARPYALILICALSAMWQLVCFHDSGRWQNAVGYTISAAFMIYIHYISLPFLLVTFLYSLQRLWQDNRNIVCRCIAMHLAVLCLILPLIYTVLFSGKDSQALSFSAYLDMNQFTSSLFMAIVTISFIFISNILSPNKRADFLPIIDMQTDSLMFYWVVIPIALSLIVSISTDYEIFVSRYFLVAYPAIALLLAATLQKIKSNLSRYVMLCSLCLYSILLTGGYDLYPSLHHEDWRGALSAVNSLVKIAEVPLLMSTGLIETRQPGWETHTADHHLLSPLAAYPVSAQVVSLPYELNNQSQAYLEKIILQKTLLLNGFIVVHRWKTNSVNEWIEKKVIPLGLQSIKIGNFQGVSAILYRRSSKE